ncbi:MAG: hypothetical protein GYB50_03785 [Rhodobacteraceae bacterium]|nr:hypothetical protein [Paracoccaceae bacterium]
MTETPRWAWALSASAKKAELEELASDAERRGHVGRPGLGSRKHDLFVWLAACRREFWDAKAAEAAMARAAPAPRARPRGRIAADLCEITAAEVNAWLCGLPAE